MPRLPTPLAAALAAAGAVGAALSLGRGLDGVGTRDDEASMPLPGDELHGPDAVVRTRAVAIAARPADVWPWLVQLGWGRAGWYSIDALERLVGVARSVAPDGTTSWRSLEEIAPEHQDLDVGDLLPLREDVGFEVASIDPEHHLVGVFDGAGLRMVWSFVLLDHGEATRLLVRTALSGDRVLVRTAARLLLDPGHAAMELVQLRRIKRLAEGHAGGTT